MYWRTGSQDEDAWRAPLDEHAGGLPVTDGAPYRREPGSRPGAMRGTLPEARERVLEHTGEAWHHSQALSEHGESGIPARVQP